MAKPALKQTNWYVIQVITGSEQLICNNLIQIMDASLYHHCFVPMAETMHKKDGKYIKITKPLFPGYLFLITDKIEEAQANIWKIARFKRILRTGNSFVPLEEAEVDVFRSLTDEAFNVSLSKGFIVGDEITVTEGPLKGHEGRIKKIDRHKRMAIIQVPFIGKETNVRMPL
ncbi:MAG: antiterminator LoaP, partial [Peptococcales bacterium]